jgi:branched-chain amino acid transport system substrate-binding protein
MTAKGRIILWLLAIGLVVWGILALNKKPEVEEAMASYKVGVLLPLTGDAAAYGEPMRNVLELAAEEINKEGINKKPVELIFEDSKCSGKDAASAMQKLVSVDKVQVVIGGFCSSESLAAVPIAAQNKVLLFSAGSSSPDLTGVSPFFFRNYPSDASQGKVLAEVSYDSKKWKNVAFIQEQLDYPLGIFKAFSATFEKLGGKVMKEEFPTNTSDFRAALTKLKAGNPDALFIDTQTPAAAARILTQLAELKWSPAILISDAVAGDQKTVADNAASLEGALAAEFGTNPSNAKFQALLAAYKAKYNEDAPYQSYAQTVYDSLFMVRDGIMNSGYSGEKLARWSRTIKNWEGASGKVTIGPDGDLVGGHVAKMIKNGKVEIYQ